MLDMGREKSLLPNLSRFYNRDRFLLYNVFCLLKSSVHKFFFTLSCTLHISTLHLKTSNIFGTSGRSSVWTMKKFVTVFWKLRGFSQSFLQFLRPWVEHFLTNAIVLLQIIKKIWSRVYCERCCALAINYDVTSFSDIVVYFLGRNFL